MTLSQQEYDAIINDPTKAIRENILWEGNPNSTRREFRVDIESGNCSELRGSEQLAACGEGIQSSGAPGTEEGSESHLGVGALG